MAENKNYKFAPITDLNLKQMGVQALADRPNAAQQYGQSGLSPTQLKRWFDKLAELLSRKVNELQGAINGEEAAKYIGIAIGEYKTLDDLLEGMQDGSFADSVLMLMPNENALAKASLQDIIYGFSQIVSEIEENIEGLVESKVDKITESAAYKRVYAVDDKGNQMMMSAAASPAGNIPLYSSTGSLIAKMSPVPGFPGAENLSEVVTMAFIQELRKHIGAGLKINLDPETYEFSVDIFNIDGQKIFTSEKIDLPLEEVVTRGTYEDGNIILTLQNGNKIVVPVANMVNGLVTQSRHEEDIKELTGRVDTMFNAYIADVYQLVGGDYVDYS